jgi:hypothetical protein
MTQIQLATGFLDVEVDFPITTSFNDIVKRGQRSGGYSNTIEIKGNENNRTLLGLYFDIDLNNDTFDRNKKTECSIIQDGVEVFNGFIQLLEINRVNKSRGSNEKLITYKVFVFDEVANFFNAMADFELDDLTFPELNHTFNRANIISSWSNTSGYLYPVFAKGDNVYTLRDFKPAIYEWEYFKKVFAFHGYTFTFPQFDDSDIRMDKRLVPYNGKNTNDKLKNILQNQYKIVGEGEFSNDVVAPSLIIGYLPSPDGLLGTLLNSYTALNNRLELDVIQDAQLQYNTTLHQITNLSGSERTFTFSSNFKAKTKVKAFDSSNNPVTNWQNTLTFGSQRVEISVSLVVQSTTNPNKRLFLDVSTPVAVWNNQSFTTHVVDLGTTQINSTGQIGLMEANEVMTVTPLVFARAYNSAGQLQNAGIYPLGTYTAQNGYRIWDGTNNVRLEFEVDLEDLTLQATPNIEELIQGAPVPVDAFIPEGIKQRDFISTLAKTYNLFFEPDPENERNIIVSTRDKYLDDGQEWDWSAKLAEDQTNTITFLSNDVARDQVYSYKEDKDELNSAYQSQLGEVYGRAKLTLDNEYTRGEDLNELIYSPTPNVSSGIGITLPAINGIDPDCNPRVLLNNGLKPCAPAAIYDSLLPDTTPQIVQSVPHLSMFDNDQTPNFSICFNAPRYLFHNTQRGQTTNYLYFLHHKREVTNLNNGEMFVGYFDLTQTDFQRLARRLNWKVYIRDNGWFYVNKIDKYNAGKRTLTRVELITLDDETNLKLPTNIGSGVLPSEQPVSGYFGTVRESTNIVLTPSTTNIISGAYNLVTGSGATVIGSRNNVFGNRATVIGDSNIVPEGTESVKVLGDGQRGSSFERVIIGSATQTGTSAPTLVIGKNNTGSVLSAVRDDAGDFRIVSDLPIFLSGACFPIITTPQSDLSWGARIYRVSDTEIGLASDDGTALSDDVLNETTFIIYIF